MLWIFHLFPTDLFGIQVVNCGIKANCPHVGLEPAGCVFSVRVFLRGSRPYLAEFWRKPLKLLKAWWTSATGDWTLHMPSTSFEAKAAWPMVGYLGYRVISSLVKFFVSLFIRAAELRQNVKIKLKTYKTIQKQIIDSMSHTHGTLFPMYVGSNLCNRWWWLYCM